MMTIEVLFPLSCNLYGDLFNIKYISQSVKDAEIIETPLFSRPAFADEDIDLIYMGPMSEISQLNVISTLKPYKERIEELIQKGTVFLFTGNALEVLCKTIEDDSGEKIECLGIFPFAAKRRMMQRHNSNFLGTFENMNIVGFKSQFSMLYGDNSQCSFAKVQKGIGINPDSLYEGICVNNFIGTYLIGPLLVLNPDFAKYILSKCGAETDALAFEKEAKQAYLQRVEEFKRVAAV